MCTFAGKTVPEWEDIEQGVETTSTLDLANKARFSLSLGYELMYDAIRHPLCSMLAEKRSPYFFKDLSRPSRPS